MLRTEPSDRDHAVSLQDRRDRGSALEDRRKESLLSRDPIESKGPSAGQRLRHVAAEVDHEVGGRTRWLVPREGVARDPARRTRAGEAVDGRFQAEQYRRIGREAARPGTCIDRHDTIAAGRQSLDQAEVPAPRRVAVHANIDAPHLTLVLYRLNGSTHAEAAACNTLFKPGVLTPLQGFPCILGRAVSEVGTDATLHGGPEHCRCSV